MVSPEPLIIYQTIDTLPLHKFIDCSVDGNLYALIISGSPTNPAQLAEAWENIQQQYSEAIGGGEYSLYLSLYKEVTVLEFELNTIKSLVATLTTLQDYILQLKYDVPETVFELQKGYEKLLNSFLRINCNFNCKDDASYRELLKKCLRRTGMIKIRLDLKLISFNEIKKKNKDGKPIDRAYFDSILITISDFAKYEISENITVSKFCQRIKRYNNYCDTLKSK